MYVIPYIFETVLRTTLNPEHRELRATKTQHIYSTVFLKYQVYGMGLWPILHGETFKSIIEFGFFSPNHGQPTICSSWKSRELAERVDIFLQ